MARNIDIDLAKTPLIDILIGYTKYREAELKIQKTIETLNKRYEQDKKIFNANYDFKFILDFEEDLLQILKGEDNEKENNNV